MSNVVLMNVSIHGLASVDVHAEAFSEEGSDRIPVVLLKVQD